MKRESIFFTISISFIISIILVVVSFVILIINNDTRINHIVLDKYRPLTQMVLRQHFVHGGLNNRFEDSLKESKYEILNPNIANKVLENPKIKVVVDKGFRDVVFKVMQIDNKQYVYIKRRHMTFLIEDKNEPASNPKIYIILVFVIVLLALVLSFVITIKKLIPLKILKDKVSNLGDENFDLDFSQNNKKDEVSLLENEFKKTAKKLKEIKEARNVFIRNIMHELKTPITKGKFLTELEKNEANDLKLKEVFNRLESLINEFASIEELISSSKNIEKKSYFLNDILDNAIDILMLDENEIKLENKNIKIDVNFKLFSIAIKNLIDNAIKYSNNQFVTIKTNEQDIIFENSGNALKHNLEEYFIPFFANEDKIKNSFGLGLYIVHNILKANGYKLTYEYKDNKNIFTCKKVLK